MGNLIYRLTPSDAYYLRLAKQIEVASVVEDHDANRVTGKCTSVDAKKTVVSARVRVTVHARTGRAPRTRPVFARPTPHWRSSSLL